MKNSKQVKVISFDGLNRSGKGTQLELLKQFLKNEKKPVQVVRGDGSREGINNINYSDPQSAWWVRWQTKKDKTSNDWDNAYTVLSKEIEDEFHRFNYPEQNKNSFFLMDRCYISRWFVQRQRDKTVQFEKIVEDNQIFPNKYFILDVPKEILLSRQSYDNPKKAKFRQGIVNKWFDL